MAQDADDVAEDEHIPAAQGKSDTNPKSSDKSFFEQESQKGWSASVYGSQTVAPKLLGLGVIIAVVMIVLKKRSDSGKVNRHEKSLA